MRKSLSRFFAIFTIAVAFALSSIPAFARSFTTFDPVGSIGTFPAGINSSGSITGYYYESGYREHGFVRTAAGRITTFDLPDSIDTEPTAINSSGSITGDYEDRSFESHGFLSAN